MKADIELKATVIDDDAFRLLALPFGGPIPFPGAPRGADLDRQWFSERTDFGAPPKRVPVTWHHGMDATMGKAEIAEAGELEFDDDGGWVTVWLHHGERRLSLIRRLADAGGKLFGSSEAQDGSGRVRSGKGEVAWRRNIPGEITRWHYAGQTLSTSPQNTLSVLTPVKATLADLSSGEYAATPDFYDDLARWIDTLTTSPGESLAQAGGNSAKAGRVLASRNEARLREALGLLDSPYDESFRVEEKRRRQAVDLLKPILEELDRRMTPVEL